MTFIVIDDYDPAEDGPFEVISLGDEGVLGTFENRDDAQEYAESVAEEYHYGTGIRNASGWICPNGMGFEPEDDDA